MSAAGFLTCLACAALSRAEPPSDLIVLGDAVGIFHVAGARRDQPEQARKLYREAAALCEELRARGAHNPDLFRNLGNAYLLAGDLPRAILTYRRGLLLAPNDADFRANLEYAREQVAFPAHSTLGRPPVDHWPPWLPRPSPRALLTAALLGYGLGCLAATRWWMVRRGWLLLFAGGAWGVCLVMAVLLLSASRDRRQAILHPMIVLAEDGVLLRTGNGLTYPPRSETPLNRGVEARLRFARGDWLQLELAGGEIGWVPREHVVLDHR